MDRQAQGERKIMWVLKALLAAYGLTALLLFLLTFFLYKTEPDEKIVSLMVVAIYVISTLIGGILIGKMAKVKRFLWGFMLGMLYFLLLLVISFAVYRTLRGDAVSLLTTCLLCAGGGMAGGMIS